MKKTAILLLMLIPVLSIAQKPGYYNGTEGKTGEELKTALHNIIDQHIDFSYSDAKYILQYADEDPDNADNVILFYTKRSQDKDTWGTGGDKMNREHVWAKSHGNFSGIWPMDGDAYNLHPADASVNITRSNYDFDECSETGNYIEEADAYYLSSQDKFEPSDAAKGEVARTIFYMAVRYEGTDGEKDLEAVDAVSTYPNAKHGKLSTLLQWNRDFPPTDLERRRNERVSQAQQNRNPFIDNPEFADLIWAEASGSDISIGNLEMTENYPLAGSTTAISVTITGNTSATFYYGTEFDSETKTVAMTESGDNWTGDFDLSDFSAGDMIYYKITAINGEKNQSLRGSYTIPENKSLTAISDIQGTGNASPMSGSIINIGGIVTANFNGAYYIQNSSDARNGICVYDIRRAKIGDSIVVTGEVVEYETLTEISDVSYSYTYNTNNTPDIPVITIAEAGEDYEGMLVTFENVTFLEGDTEIPSSDAATLHFTDGNNTMNVYSRYNSRLGGEIVPAGTVTVTGVVSQYKNNYQLLINSIDYIVVGEDFDPPMLGSIIVNDAIWIEVSFNEKIDKTSAENLSNYTISDGVNISAAYLYGDTKVLLMVTGLREQDYTLTVSNITDLQGNAISETSKTFHSDFSSVGIEDFEQASFNIWPNPASNQLQLDIPSLNSEKNINCRIIDIQGKVLYENKLNYRSGMVFGLDFLANGFYLMQINFDDTELQSRFSIRR